MLQHHAIEGRDTDHGAGAEPLDGVKGRIHVDLGQQYQGSAHKKRGQTAGLPQDMKQRRIPQNDILFGWEQRFADPYLFIGGH